MSNGLSSCIVQTPLLRGESSDVFSLIATAVEWRPVVGYEGIYEVSNDGRVRRVLRSMGTACKELSPRIDKDGYAGLSLRKDGKSTSHKVHHLVITAFIGSKPYPRWEVDHADGQHAHNHISNLEWVSHKENNRRKIARGLTPTAGLLHQSGEQHHAHKLTESDVRNIRAEHLDFIERVSAQYGVTKQAIRYILGGQTWKDV